MERLLLLWDDLDDLAWACRHVAASAAGELAGLGASLTVAAATLGGAFLAGATLLHTALLRLSFIG